MNQLTSPISRRRKVVWLFVRFLLFVFHASLIQAQPLPASAVLDGYVREGVAKNLALAQESLEVRRVAEGLTQAKALFYPRVTFNPTYSLAAGGRNINFPVGDLLNPAYTALNKLTGSDRFPTNIENVNQLLAPHNFHDTKLTVSYAVFNTDIQYNYLIQKELLTAQQARQRVVENEVRYTIETAYFQYLQTLDALRIYQNARAILTGLVRLNQKLVANNVATKDVVSSADYEVSKLDQQMAGAERNRQTAGAYFNFLLNRDLTRAIDIDSALVRADPAPTETLAGLTETALHNRQEINQLDGSLRAAQTAVKLNEASARLPNVYVGGNTGFQGFGYTFRNQAYLVAQVGLSWDLFKGYEKQSKIRQSRLQADALSTRLNEVKQQISLQVLQAQADLNAAGASLTATRQGSAAAGATFRVVDSRYRNGQALLIEWLKAQNDQTTAQLQQSLARYDRLIKAAALNRAVAVGGQG
jgi:outer membrane protein